MFNTYIQGEGLSGFWDSAGPALIGVGGSIVGTIIATRSAGNQAKMQLDALAKQAEIENARAAQRAQSGGGGISMPLMLAIGLVVVIVVTKK